MVIGLSACSGSIFDSSDPQDPVADAPIPNRPVAAPSPSSQPSPGAVIAMSFTLDPSPDLADAPFDILFKDQAFTPFDVQEALTKPITASLKLWKIKDFPDYHEVQADGRLHIEFVNKDNVTLLRDFRPEGLLSVKRIEQADVIEGSLRDVEGKGTIIKLVDVRRKAADTEAQARANAWNGFIKVTRDGKDLPLGRLTGPSQ